jgi:hypothetical protein
MATTKKFSRLQCSLVAPRRKRYLLPISPAQHTLRRNEKNFPPAMLAGLAKHARCRSKNFLAHSRPAEHVELSKGMKEGCGEIAA